MKIIDKEKPIMLFDGDCNFCRRWIARWQKNTGDRILFAPYQKVIQNYSEVTERQCKKAVQLILPHSKVYSGAYAVFKMFSLVGKYTWLLWLYEHISVFAWLSDITYELIAKHR